MRLFYRICERPIKRLKTTHPQTIESKSGSGSSLNNANSNNNGNNSVSQSKLVASQASTSTSNTSTFTTIMTGAATLPTLPTTPTKSSNNSGATGVTLTKGSNTTPKNADTISASTVNAYRVTSSPTAATPQGIFKSTHMSASAVQTDEPPKKLRKILPANNSSATTPKALPITINCSTSTTLSSTTTSSSTVNSLRQCRINTDKNKSLCSTVNTNSNVGLSVCKPSVKEETKCVNSAITTTSLGSVKKSSSRKSSAFDVRTLIGTKSPTLPSQRQCVESAISGNECKDEIGINDKNSTNTTSIGNNGIGVKPAKGNSNVSLSSSVRELNRNTVTSSMCSMPSTLSSITTGSSANKKPLSNSSSVAISRPPTNRSTSLVPTLRPFVPLKITKSGTFVSPKQLNAKSLKASQNDISVKSCNRDVKSDNTNNKMSNKPITTTKDVPQIQPNKPQRQSNPLSPPSIRIKLPPPPTTTSPSKASSASPKITTSVHNNSKNSSNAKEQTQQSKQTESSRQQDLNKSHKDLPQIGLTQQKSVQNHSNSKSSISQTSLTKTKGAAINQIVSKIASAVTAKSTSVNVTSTTPTLELSKTKTASGLNTNIASGLNTNIASGFKSNISGAQTLGLSSTKVSANEVNDDKVSTTTNESGVSSSIQKDESAIKALTSATTNTGNLVIRISTKSHSVESFTQLKDKDKNSTQRTNKFEIKRDLNLSKLNPQTDGNNTQCLNGKNDNNHKSETELKSVNNLNDDEDDDDDDNSIDGRKLVVDVPNEDSCENEVGTSKVTLEMDDIDSGRGSDIIRLSCDDIEMGSPQSTTLSIKTPESLSASSDISTKLAINITSTTTLSANSAVLASPPPTPSPKSESDPCITVVTKSNKNSSSPPNGPLDLSMSSTNKKDSYQKIVTPPAIYDIPAPKPKHCVNPAVLDKHRGLFPPGLSAPNKQHPSFKIITTPSHSSRQQPQQSSSFLPSTNFNSSKKDRSINPNPSITTTGSSSSNQSRNRSQVSHHHQHHHHHKNYSVITPDPHRYTPKLVIKNISSPPSITSHFNYPTHH
jgi:hypothetical protein